MSDVSRETKQWVSVVTSTKGTTVSVALVDGHCSARWAGKAFSTSLKDDIKRARDGARRNLKATQEALAELDEEES